MSSPTLTANDFKVADLSLAAFGRKGVRTMQSLQWSE